MSSTTIPEKFTGFGAVDEASGKAFNLTKIEYTPKVWSEDDVDIAISHCGVCGSDSHTITNGWPSPTSYFCIVGHEVVGTVVRAGKNSGHTVGARVGVGAQAGSCGECTMCEKKREQYCYKGMLGTYQGKWEDGSVAQGGYADFMRCRGRFAIPIPEGLDSETVAPLMCAGATTYSPLKRFGAGPGKKVGIIGIGGLVSTVARFHLHWAPNHC
jgi:alcohol dehydrogenase (NADP+)